MAGSSYLGGEGRCSGAYPGPLIAHLGAPCPDVWFHLIVRPEA